MELTQKQELYIARYLRSIRDLLAGQLDERPSERALSRLHARILDQIAAQGQHLPEDTVVLDILRKQGTPEQQAAIMTKVWGKSANENSATSPPSLSPHEITPFHAAAPGEEECSAPVFPASPRSNAIPKGSPSDIPPVWLGVVSYWAKTSGIPAWALRTLLVVLGLVTAPLLLSVYIGVYAWLRTSGHPGFQRPLRWGRLLFQPLLTTILTTALHFAGFYAIKGIHGVYDLLLKRPMPEIAEWAWFQVEGQRMWMAALLLLLPFSVLGALPLTNSWDYSIRRLTQAGIALYAIAVSFGIASFITGLILAFVQEFTQT